MKLYGPFHRLQSAEMNELVERSGQLWGRPARNYYAGHFPAVKAWAGPLPPGSVGIEFVTPVPPGKSSPPHGALWSQGDPGVAELTNEDAVFIPVTITRRIDR